MLKIKGCDILVIKLMVLNFIFLSFFSLISVSDSRIAFGYDSLVARLCVNINIISSSSHLKRLSTLDSSWVFSSQNGLNAHNHPAWLTLYLAACKLLDLMLALPAQHLPQFQMWVVVNSLGDTSLHRNVLLWFFFFSHFFLISSFEEQWG